MDKDNNKADELSWWLTRGKRKWSTILVVKTGEGSWWQITVASFDGSFFQVEDPIESQDVFVRRMRQ
jgi:hypothetical protein